MPPEPLRYKHSFNSGDLVTILPGIKHVYEQTGRKAILLQRLNLAVNYGHNDPHPVTHDGKHVCMNEEIFLMMKPLIESQEYIQSFEIWKGEKVDIDFDMTRHDARMPLPGALIQKWPVLIYPQLECDLSKPWLREFYDYKKCDISDIIIINRTARYRNPYANYFFLKPHQDKILFVGTKNEHSEFCKEFELDISWLYVKNFQHLANNIASCRFFVGNQSMCYQIAESLKVPRILEVCTAYPNTFPIGENGYCFVAQEALEYNFERLLKQTE